MNVDPSRNAISEQLMAAMRGESGAPEALIALGELGVQAMLQTRNRGPYPPERHVIDAARRLSDILQSMAYTDPTPLLAVARHPLLQLEDAELADLMRILQTVETSDEDAVVELALLLLDHTNPFVRYHCVRVLLQFPRERAREALLRRLQDSSLMVRRRVIHGMIANGFFRTAEALPELNRLLSDARGSKRGSLLWAEMKTLQRIIQTERPGAQARRPRYCPPR